MRKQWIGIIGGSLFATALFVGSATAGVYSDDLAKCFVNSTTTGDRNGLVRWMFTSAASHPAVSSIVTVSEAQHRDSDKYMARLSERLLFEACKKETEQAVKYEGQLALQTGFQVLGQVAGRELFADPSVSKAMSNLNSYINKEKMDGLLGSAQHAK
jgi:hypothetical protein